MKTLKKRILSGAMAGVLALSLAVPALADDDTETTTQTNTQTVITATYTEIPIAVTVPRTGTAQINPYGLPVEIGTLTGETTAEKVSGQQIVTEPVAIQNDGDVALQVGATVTGTVTGGLKLATAALAEGTTTNSAFVYLQMKGTAAISDATTATDVTDAILRTAADENWSTAYVEANDVILGTKAVTKDNMFTLAAATLDEDDGSVTAYAENSIAVVRFAGQVVESPKTAWTESDGFTATIAFTFKPAPTTPGTGD